MQPAASGPSATGSSTSFPVRDPRLVSVLDGVSADVLPALDDDWNEMSVDVVARMLEDLQLGPTMRVLVVEPLSGYLPVLLSRLCGEVVVVSSEGRRAVALREQLDAAGADRVKVHTFLEEPEGNETFDRMVVVRPANEELGPVLLGMLSPRGCAMWSVDSHNMPPRRVRRLLLLDGGEHVEEDLDLEHFSPLLGDMLVDAGVAMRQEVAEALETANEHGRRLGEELLARGSVSERELFRVLGKQHGTGYVDAASVLERLDVDFVSQLPRKFLDYNMCLPIRRDGDTVTVATADMSLSGEDLDSLFDGATVVRELITPTDLQRIWVAIELGLVGQARAPGSRAAIAASSPAAGERALQRLVADMQRAGAGTAHVERAGGASVTRFRIDLRLVNRSDWQLDEGAVDALFGLFQSARTVTVTVGGADVRCVGHVIASRNGADLAVQLAGATQGDALIEHLGLPREVADGYREAVSGPRGLVLVGGPSRSGRAVTVRAAAAELRADTTRKVITIDSLTLADDDSSVDRGIAAAIRTAVAADADVICVEIECDGEAVQAMVRAAQSGRTVVAVVSGNDTADVLSRLADHGVGSHAITNDVKAVLVQLLARRACDACRGQGCDHCDGTGARGCAPVVEYLPLHAAIRRSLRRGVAPQDLGPIATQSGMRTMATSAAALLGSGEVTRDELRRVLAEEQFDGLGDAASTERDA